jgi:NADP-dependent 3-hydroxy acid dehydrogenase YdfG
LKQGFHPESFEYRWRDLSSISRYLICRPSQRTAATFTMGGLFSRSSSSSSSTGEYQFTGRKVLITGASSGIGACLARLLAKEGTHMALMGRDLERLNAVAQDCREIAATAANPSQASSPIQVEVYTCDLTDNDDMDKATAAAVQDFENFDALFLVAGRSQGCYFEEIRDAKQIDYMLKINVSGVLLMIQKLLPFVYKSNHSRIVILSSVSGIVAVPYRTIYCATKHALTGFSRALRMELQDTYGVDQAPIISLINFPEIKDTALNDARMDFGGTLPPARFSVDAALGLEESCIGLLEAVRQGKREWGEPTKAKILLPLYRIIPQVIDKIVMAHVKSTHFRPTSAIDQEK